MDVLPLELLEVICAHMDTQSLRRFNCTNKLHYSIGQPILKAKLQSTQIVIVKEYSYYVTWDGQLFLATHLVYGKPEFHNTPLLTNIAFIQLYFDDEVLVRDKQNKWYKVEPSDKFMEPPKVTPQPFIPPNIIKVVHGIRAGTRAGLTNDGNLAHWDKKTGTILQVHSPKVKWKEIYQHYNEIIGVDENGDCFSYDDTPISIFTTSSGLSLHTVPSILASDSTYVTMSDSRCYKLNHANEWWETRCLDIDLYDTDDEYNTEILWRKLDLPFQPLILVAGHIQTVAVIDEKGYLRFMGGVNTGYGKIFYDMNKIITQF